LATDFLDPAGVNFDIFYAILPTETFFIGLLFLEAPPTTFGLMALD